AAAFPNHPAGRPTGGTVETLTSLPEEAIRGAVARQLRGDGMILAAAGAISAEELARVIPALFEGLPEGAPAEPPALPAFTGFGRRVIEVASPQSAVLFGQAGLAVADPDWETAQVVLRVLGGGGFSSRLMEAVRVRRGLTYGIGVGLDSLFGQGVIVGSTATDNARVAETLAVTKDEWRRMAGDGPTREELDDAVAFLTGNLPLQFTDSRRIAGTLLALRRNNRPVTWLNERADRLRALTPAATATVARRVLQPDALAVAIAGRPEGV
ncbi:M16 family metallopeptidase, partial [Falsiroseomonas oryziterrae]|uniref:M16 family metallopeptidase n=1 Tax=Falsiroseomonas oryziterrae TaxID=2911368 RepID=UPI001F425CF7